MTTSPRSDAAKSAGRAGVDREKAHDHSSNAERMYQRIVGELRRISSFDLDGLAEEALARGDYRRAFAIAAERDRRWEFVRRHVERYGT
jgi:hypothetical protein